MGGGDAVSEGYISNVLIAAFFMALDFLGGYRFLWERSLSARWVVARHHRHRPVELGSYTMATAPLGFQATSTFKRTRLSTGTVQPVPAQDAARA